MRHYTFHFHPANIVGSMEHYMKYSYSREHFYYIEHYYYMAHYMKHGYDIKNKVHWQLLTRFGGLYAYKYGAVRVSFP